MACICVSLALAHAAAEGCRDVIAKHVPIRGDHVMYMIRLGTMDTTIEIMVSSLSPSSLESPEQVVPILFHIHTPGTSTAKHSALLYLLPRRPIRP